MTDDEAESEAGMLAIPMRMASMSTTISASVKYPIPSNVHSVRDRAIAVNSYVNNHVVGS